MAVKIRLQRKGRKRKPFYYVVVADSRSPRDGRFIDRLGSYDPIPAIQYVSLDADKAIYWLNNGAIATKTVRRLLSQEGILYKKHLLRGLKMGILAQEEADQKFSKFLQEKSKKLEDRISNLKTKKNESIKERLAREAAINTARAKLIAEKRKLEIEQLTGSAEEEATGEVVEETAVEETPQAETEKPATEGDDSPAEEETKPEE